MEKKTYIVAQMIITERIPNGTNYKIGVATILRRVEAESKESAIGKFVMETKDIDAVQKLDIECLDFNELISIS